MSTLKKKAQVILLPSNKGTKLWSDKSGENLIGYNYDQRIGSNGISYHLYIVYDDEIKEGDWFLEFINNQIILRKCLSNKELLHQIGIANNGKKVIATTDTSLKIQGVLNQWNVNDKYLPQPSNGFITKYIECYNLNNVISDILVDYNDKGYIKHVGDPRYGNPTWFPNDVLKTDKNNEITISSIKNSWDRDEIINLFNEFVSDIDTFYNGQSFNKKNFDGWIKNNLN